MASSIGVRVYQISLYRKGDNSPLDFHNDSITIMPPDFVSKFILEHSSSIENKEMERSWYFEERQSMGAGNTKGLIHYGTFGFESDFVDVRTKLKNYRRKTTDTEIVPLFYEFWYPHNAKYILVLFQSFQGRSCVQLVTSRMEEMFRAQNPGHRIRFRKLLPNDKAGSIYASAPVKQLRLIKRNASNDLADKYFSPRPTSEIKIELSISAKRSGSLGPFESLMKSLRKNAAGIVAYDGVSFDQAVAEIHIGGRRRPVSVFGTSPDAGVIDLSNDIKRGTDGHPTFDSIASEANAILRDFQAMLSGLRHED